MHQEIQKKGQLSQSDFMEIALSHPLYGYYRSEEAINRDFTTSPEISQVFGELIGLWSLDTYLKLNHPKKITLIEMGPGKGTLMADFLRAIRVSKSFLEAIDLYLVEINPLLKTFQEKAISHSKTWTEDFKEIPISHNPLIIIANEFFDVLPTDLFVRKDNQVFKRYVVSQKEEFEFKFDFFHNNPGPDQFWEESLKTDLLMQEVCERLLKQSGIFLIFDYGYEKGQGDSFQALYRGQPSHPLSFIGKSDLSCHVNFGRLKEIAHSYNLGVLGPISQGKFLKNIGIDERIEILKQKNPAKKSNLEAGALRLTHPQQMGTIFKVMAVFSPLSLSPVGFES